MVLMVSAIRSLTNGDVMKRDNKQSAVSDVARSRQEIVRVALTFPMDAVVQRFAKEQGLDIESAREYEQELKRYLALCALDPKECYGMRGMVDLLWHTFIIFTHAYATFCENVARMFLHHVPPSIDGEISKESHDAYVRFLKAYRMQYGEEPPSHIWPAVTTHQSTFLHNCSNCNARCHCSGNSSVCLGRVSDIY